jgi:DNA polymerase-2
MKGFIVYPSYEVKENKAYVKLYGRLENGESFLAVNYFRPYFFIRKKEVNKLKDFKSKIEFETQDTEFKNFNEEKISKITLNNPREVPVLRKEFEELGIIHYEADIRFVQRFLMDYNIKGSLDINGDFEKGEYLDRIYKDPEIYPAEYEPELKLVSIDIETDEKAKRIFSIAIYSEEFKKVFIHSKKKIKNGKSFPDEKSMLKFFIKKIKEHDPDIITGWNVVDFDLKVLMKRAKELGLEFNIGRSEKGCYIRTYKSFFRDSIAKIPGRMVLDGITLLKISFIRTEDYKLETAAQEFLGESKLGDFNKFNKAEKIKEWFKSNPEKLVEYNLKDAELVYKILKKKKLIELTIQRSILTGMELDRVNSSIASLDNLYLRETKKLGYVVETRKYNERDERIKGGYVMDSLPGIYEYIDVLDFKSLYPSIIRTFNIDPLSYVNKNFENKYKKNDLIRAPNNAKFKKQEGILPQLIQRLWEQRDKAKKENNQEESYAIKITMNSFFGVLANPMCRFYNLDIANSITSFGREIVKKTAALTQKKGYQVIYGDTDSIFVKTKANNIKDAKNIGKKLSESINDYWDKYVKEKTGKKSYLELEFEKTYIKFLMPKIRGSKKGAKKRYAGILLKNGKEIMDFTGLEFVRRDWTDLAKKFQLKLLKRVFHKKKISEYIKKFVDDLKKGKYNDLIVYKKAIRKNLDEYIKTTPPHVKAARKLDKLDSNIISYIITVDGPEPIQKLQHSIDYDHYIEKQIKPIANSILGFIDTNFYDVMQGTEQTSLLKF